MSSHHHLILFHLNVLNHHISSLHFFSAHSSSVTSLFFPSICSLPPTCFRATLSSSFFCTGVAKQAGVGEGGSQAPAARPEQLRASAEETAGNMARFDRHHGRTTGAKRTMEARPRPQRRPCDRRCAQNAWFSDLTSHRNQL